MSKKQHILTVRGREHEWTFELLADTRHVKEWQADGVEIYPLENRIPEWVTDAGLARPWCFIQDLFHFRNPWRA